MPNILIYMDHLTSIPTKLLEFIQSDHFFFYHGITLASLWFVGAIIAILLRRVSRQLHGITFFFIDAISLFFSLGALYRVYPKLDGFASWNLLVQGHVIGGALFTVLLIIQHIGGVSTLLGNVTYNPSHRKMAFFVSNLGRILAVFGFVIAEAQAEIIYAAAGLAVVLLAASFYKVFVNPEVPKGKTSKNPELSPRQKSPKQAKRQ